MERGRSSSTTQSNTLRLETRELTLIAVFASLWVAAQALLGPIVGKLSVGPFSLHGAVNRLAGWLLMLVLAELTGRFGRVTLMASIAALVTRVFRRSSYALGGLAIGAGYAVGGLTFDLLYTYRARKLNGLRRKTYLLLVAGVSGAIASVPYLSYNLFALGVLPFLLRSPIYAQSTIKGIVFSGLGTLIGLSSSSKIRNLWPYRKAS